MKNRFVAILSAVVLIASVGTVIFFVTRPPAPITLTDEERENFIRDTVVIDWETLEEKLKSHPSLYSHYPTPADKPEAFMEVYTLGCAAAPYLVNWIVEGETKGQYEAFLTMASATNLHLSSLLRETSSSDAASVYSASWNVGTPKWHAYQLQQFAKNAPEQVEAICNDRTLSLSEKTEWLAEYGMLAVPLLQDRMRRGEFWWEETVLLLTMAPLSAEERFQLLLDSYSSEIQTSPARNRLILERRREMLAGKKLPKTWFAENAEELDLLRYWYN